MEPSVAEALIPRFKIEKLLNQDQGGRRLTLLGTVDSHQSLLIIERAALPTDLPSTKALQAALTSVQNLGANDIYHWYLASYNTSILSPPQPDLKLNLIHPCTAKHIRKYSPQKLRVVTETPQIFRDHVRPYMVKELEGGRIGWVFNIIEGRKEQEDIIYRESNNLGWDTQGFLLLPDMNWDRRTMSSLRILGLVERRDLLSMRDLKKKHLPWLKGMYKRVLDAVARTYKEQGIEQDLLKVYVHYQPTYYHFHLHIVSTQLEPNATQATGKAFSLPNIISELEGMAGGDGVGMADVDVTYTVGEGSEIWEKIFSPLKQTSDQQTEVQGADASGST